MSQMSPFVYLPLLMQKYEIYKHLQTKVALTVKVKIILLLTETSHPFETFSNYLKDITLYAEWNISAKIIKNTIH